MMQSLSLVAPFALSLPDKDRFSLIMQPTSMRSQAAILFRQWLLAQIADTTVPEV